MHQESSPSTNSISQKEYDLINELGPANRYDKLAGEAQVFGTRWHMSSLIRMGKSLAELIANTPYDHDDFSKVIALANEIELKIEEYSKYTRQIETIKDQNSGYYPTWEYSLIDYNGGYIISISNWHNRGDLEDPAAKEITQLLEDYVGPLLDPAQTTDVIKNQNTITKYLNNDGEVIKEHIFHVHESGEEGFDDRYYFYDLELAEICWNKIKSAHQALSQIQSNH